MTTYPGDDLTTDEIAVIAKKAGEATAEALRGASVAPDFSTTRAFELIFQAMLVAKKDGSVLTPLRLDNSQESVS